MPVIVVPNAKFYYRNYLAQFDAMKPKDWIFVNTRLQIHVL